MPYTYLIGWSAHNKWYYGVRFSEKSSPDDLWKTYFTSSKYVHRFIEEYGAPDTIEIRKTFSCSDSARRWESGVLRRLGVVHNDKWLNRTNNIAIRNGQRVYKSSWNKDISTPRTPESIEKQKATMTGTKRGPYFVNLTDETRELKRQRMLGNRINSGRKQTAEEKKARSESGKGIVWWTNGLTQVKCKTCPPNFVRGRLKKRRPFQQQVPGRAT